MKPRADYAVHVPNEQLSRMVQDRFFSIGAFWGEIRSYLCINVHYGERTAIGYRPDGNYAGLSFCPVEYFRQYGVPVLSAEEFLQKVGQVMMLLPRR